MWRSPIWWMLPFVAMLFASTPWFIGLAMKPADRSYFAAYAKAPGDTSVYYRYINEGRHGGPFMLDGFTSEDHEPILWQPLWWVIGRGAELVDLSTPVAYAAARILLSGLLAITIVWSAALIFSDRLTRLVAAWTAYFGAGIGGLLALVQLDRHIWPPVYDLWVSEGFPWMSSLASPHFLLVTTGLLFVVVGVEYSWTKRWVRWLAGPVLFLVISIHPFHVLTLAVMWLAVTALELWRHAGDFRNFWRRALVGAWSIPAILYYVLITRVPLIDGRAAQNVNPTYAWHMILGILPLAVMVVVGVIRRIQMPRAFLFWSGAIMVLTFLPVVFQRRLFHPASLVLAFAGAPIMARLIQSGGWRRWATVGGMVVMALSPAVNIGQSISFSWNNAKSSIQTFSYETPDFLAAQDALVAHPEWSPVLTGRLNGNILAATSPIRPYMAHGVETLDFTRKQAQMTAFFSSATVNEQQAFLRDEHICSILVTPYENTYGRVFTACPLESCQLAIDRPDAKLWVTGVCANSTAERALSPDRAS